MDSKEISGYFLMSWVRMLHFFKDWWKFIHINQYYKYYGFIKLGELYDTINKSSLWC